jgi:glutamate carboxypeptidase
MEDKQFNQQISQQMDWIDQQHDRMSKLVTDWVNINSGSYNPKGLAKMAEALSQAFSVLAGDAALLDLSPQIVIDSKGRKAASPLGQALRIIKRPDAPLQVLLCIHMDTVYGPDHPFQQAELIDEQRINGPGVIDAKGGLAIMLVALEALERSGLGNQSLGWQVLINPDEEIGSTGSMEHLVAAAKSCHLGLLYEPTLPDGSMAASRRGSGNFTLIVRGRSAHVGRAFDQGRNAMHLLAKLIVQLTQWSQDKTNEVIFNVGRIEGGGPTNVVPDLAMARINMRVNDSAGQKAAESQLRQLIDSIDSAGAHEGYTVELAGGFGRPPKVLDGKALKLKELVTQCGSDLAMDIHWVDTGGTCDGNSLAGAGLVNIDTLGAQGNHLHSPKEYLELSSLTLRAKLSAMILMKLAAGQFQWPK